MNIGIIGLGLIGGSLGRAFCSKTKHTVYGFDISEEVNVKAELLSAMHKRLTDEDLIKIDALIIALNPKATVEEMRRVAPLLKSGAVVTDIAGNKTMIVGEMKKLGGQYRDISFISTHPMAGREFSGISHSTPKLFEQAPLLIIPVTQNIEAISLVKGLFLEAGFSFFKITTKEEHDEIIAYTSQLAHIVSSAYCQSPLASRHDGFSAGSFKDLTRVAKMNPAMWTELLLGNRENVLDALKVFTENIRKITAAIEEGDARKLNAYLEEGNTKKEDIEKSSRLWKKENSIKE